MCNFYIREMFSLLIKREATLRWASRFFLSMLRNDYRKTKYPVYKCHKIELSLNFRKIKNIFNQT